MIPTSFDFFVFVFILQEIWIKLEDICWEVGQKLSSNNNNNNNNKPLFNHDLF